MVNSHVDLQQAVTALLQSQNVLLCKVFEKSINFICGFLYFFSHCFVMIICLSEHFGKNIVNHDI